MEAVEVAVSGMRRGKAAAGLGDTSGASSLVFAAPLPATMPQAMLATLALLLGTLYAMQRQRAIFDGQMRMVVNEMEMLATSVAKDRLELIGTLAFDHATRDAGRITAASQLTPAASFRNENADVDDLDDFHASADTLRRVVGGQTFEFRATARVLYVSESDGATPSNTQTRTKQVTVWVRGLTIAPQDSVRLQQTFTCGSACNW